MPVSYLGVLQRLEEIEQTLALRQEEWEATAAAVAVAKRDYEREEAAAFLKAEGPVEERKRKALEAVIESGYFETYITAEAAESGARRVVKLLDLRSTIGMALLKAMQREGDGSRGPQPAWSNGATS